MLRFSFPLVTHYLSDASSLCQLPGCWNRQDPWEAIYVDLDQWLSKSGLCSSSSRSITWKHVRNANSQHRLPRRDPAFRWSNKCKQMLENQALSCWFSNTQTPHGNLRASIKRPGFRYPATSTYYYSSLSCLMHSLPHKTSLRKCTTTKYGPQPPASSKLYAGNPCASSQALHTRWLWVCTHCHYLRLSYCLWTLSKSSHANSGLPVHCEKNELKHLQESPSLCAWDRVSAVQPRPWMSPLPKYQISGVYCQLQPRPTNHQVLTA